MTVRAGRPRLDRPRYRSGQIRPVDAGITAQQLHRLREVSRDPWLGSRVGQLLFMGQLNQSEAECAWLIAEIYGRYENAMGLKRHGASPAYERGYGHDLSEESDEDLKRKTKAIRRYEFLINEICGLGMGPSVLEAIQRLCVDDWACEPGTLPRVKRALGTLSTALGVRAQTNKERQR